MMLLRFPGGTEENCQNLSQDIWSLGRDLNKGSQEYEAGVGLLLGAALFCFSG